MKPTLLIMAAGMGSRYGGLKQMDPVGPQGETIIDYSVYDALRAGFGKLVFVIRQDLEADFKALVGRKFEARIATEYVFQELDKLPAGFSMPPQRTKPWGTTHAILMGEEVVHEPFAAINADDFYGAQAFHVLAEYLQSEATDYAMVGYLLRNTLSAFGGVSRGVTQTDAEGFLQGISERTKVEKNGPAAKYTEETGAVHPLTGDERVSMNFWGFQPTVFPHLRRLLVEFLQEHGRAEKSEYYIPTAVGKLVQTQQARVKVLRSNASWFGVTYKEDRPQVIQSIRQLIARGEYPETLWA